jgi:maltooligosyltrehalose trehalohydrolase
VRPEIWAPDAESVELELDGARVRCDRSGEHWRSSRDLRTGERYRFVVDGTVVPDPRSRSQPDGVHGPSVVTDPLPPAATPTTVGLERAVIYELHVGTFSEPGTFRGAVAHLDHLVSLGVSHVELMPVAAFDGEFGWGYDGVCLYAPHPVYGTVEDLRHLVDECHRRGLAVLLDVVYNHLGPSGNYLPVSGPYFTDRYSTPWGDAVNLDGPGSDGVRSHLIGNALYWLEEVGFDGLRLDAVHELFDTSAVTLLEQLRAAVTALEHRVGRQFVLVAESDRNDPRIVSPAPAGTGLDGVWADDLHHILHVALTGERQGYYEDYHADDLPLGLLEACVYQQRYSPHRRRHVGRNVEGTRSSAFVAALQNHDQIGNRAGGERLHHLVGPDQCAAAAALVQLSPFTALLFQGEEWAASSPFPYFSDHSGELGEAVRRGRRHEFAAFGWAEEDVVDPQDRATFESARLRWDELDRPVHREMLEWYRQLLALRREHPALGPATLPVPGHRCSAQGGLVVVDRGSLRVVANLRDEPARVSPSVLRGEVLLSRGESGPGFLGGGASMVIDPGHRR